MNNFAEMNRVGCRRRTGAQMFTPKFTSKQRYDIYGNIIMSSSKSSWEEYVKNYKISLKNWIENWKSDM